MLRLEVLPARYGDCLWVEYGSNPVRRLLIDGGAPGVYKRTLKPRIEQLPVGERAFELLVVTHVDYDHIRGIIELALDDSLDFRARDVWFNGFRHIPDKPVDVLAGKHGEQLTDLILSNGIDWNAHGFDRGAVVVPEEGPLPRVEFDGGLSLTLLSPTVQLLADLREDWEHSCEDINIGPEELEQARAEGRFETLAGPADVSREARRPDIEQLLREEFEEDTSAANGSSIALLLEYQDRRILLAGDAHPGTLVESIRRLGVDRLRLDACKLPHHGSRGSVSVELIEHLDCPAYIFSSNGDQFRHPHPEAVARVIKHGGSEPQLIFNYRHPQAVIWDDETLRRGYGYSTSYPPESSQGAVLAWGPAE
jgi:metal-dependent hydrolase (beta-lactamase superfamily II)